MDWELHGDRNSGGPYMRLEYGEFTGYISHYKVPNSEHIVVMWQVRGKFSKIMFEQNFKYSMQDLYHKYRYKWVSVTEQEVLYNLYKEYTDITRTALFCAVLEKLHAAHNRRF